MSSHNSWRKSAADPEKLHGKEEWANIKKRYSDNRWRSGVNEVQMILEHGFVLPDPITPPELDERTGELISYATFVWCNVEFQTFLNDYDLITSHSKEFEALNKSDRRTEKESIKDDIISLSKGCGRVYSAVADVLREYLESELKSLQNSQRSYDDMISRLDRLVDQANDLISFFGVRYPDDKANSGGLIYGTDIFDCLYSIRDIGPLADILERQPIPQDNYFSVDQTDVSISTLETLQTALLKKGKDFIALQMANISDTSRSDIKKDKVDVALSIDQRIINKAKELTGKGSSKHDFKVVLAFFRSVYNHPNTSVNKQREYALEVLDQIYLKQKLSSVENSVLYTWRDKVDELK